MIVRDLVKMLNPKCPVIVYDQHGRLLAKVKAGDVAGLIPAFTIADWTWIKGGTTLKLIVNYGNGESRA